MCWGIRAWTCAALVALVSHSIALADAPPTLIDGSLDASQVPDAAPLAVGSPTITFFDGTFSTDNWSPGPLILSNNTAGGSQTNQQTLTGGNPDAFRQFSTLNNSSGGITYRATFFSGSFFYSPATSGAITDMGGGFSMNLLSATGISDVFDASLLLRQNGSIYRPSNFFGLADTAPGWYGSDHMFGTGGAVPIGSSSNWSLADGAGPAHPDFTAAGATIQFGYLAGTFFSAGPGSNVGGLDNFTVRVTPAPEPSMPALLGFALLLCRRKRIGWVNGSRCPRSVESFWSRFA